MTIDLWGLGLQAINVLILIWLLTRVFWRPVAAAIAARQKVAQDLLGDAELAKTKADAALAEVASARDAIAAERAAALAQAVEAGHIAAKKALAEAAAKADALAKAADVAMAQAAAKNRATLAKDAAQLGVSIAEKLLGRLNEAAIQGVFLDLLVQTIAALPDTSKAGLRAAEAVDLVSPLKQTAPQQASITKAVEKALGHPLKLSFRADPDLIAGFELYTPHFVLHNSWRADLTAILKGMDHAA
jgi:F-type H+-transporting ATPase subunit b